MTAAERTRVKRLRLSAAARNSIVAYYASKRRVDLVRVLAPDGRCRCCKRRVGVRCLEIDHMDGRDWQPRELSSHMRAARYWREYLAGVRLRALCRKCNGSDGGYRRWHK